MSFSVTSVTPRLHQRPPRQVEQRSTGWLSDFVSNAVSTYETFKEESAAAARQKPREVSILSSSTTKLKQGEPLAQTAKALPPAMQALADLMNQIVGNSIYTVDTQNWLPSDDGKTHGPLVKNVYELNLLRDGKKEEVVTAWFPKPKRGQEGEPVKLLFMFRPQGEEILERHLKQVPTSLNVPFEQIRGALGPYDEDKGYDF